VSNPAAGLKVDFFRDDDGNLPVSKWLESLPEDVRGKVIARIDLLRDCGPTLDYPYTSQIEGRLREGRLRMGKTRYCPESLIHRLSKASESAKFP
jgi:phage-related protein